MEKTISLIAFVAAVMGLVFLIQKQYIFSTNPLTITIQVASVALMIWSRIVFGKRSFHAAANTTEGELITSGPYHVLRHPIYASIIYFSWSILIAFPKLECLAAVLVITAGLIVRMLIEEHSLKNTYPAYEAYSHKTKRVIPFVF
jgi:protein-S-isoprenylcysteine O-methyltransferase Ste14